MTPRPPRIVQAAGALIVSLALGLAGCSDVTTTPESPFQPSFAKPGSGDPTVGTVDPSSAPQDTTLDVIVNGTGFDNGSVVTLLLQGQPTGKVVTNNTVFVNNRKLVASITIAADADVAFYDVEVRTFGGKRGVGTEKFEIQLKGNIDTDSRAIWAFHGTTADGAAALLGDGRDANGAGSGLDPSTYQGDRCGVHAKIFAANETASRSGDAVIQPAGDYNQVQCGAARTVTASLGSGSALSVWSMNVKCVMQLVPGYGIGPCWDPEAQIDPTDPTIGYYTMGVTTESRACERLRWDPEIAGGAFSGHVKVTYLGTTGPGGARQWSAETQPPHAAGCYTWKKGKYSWDGTTRTVPFRIMITEVPFAG
jgi:hypothetical protein